MEMKEITRDDLVLVENVGHGSVGFTLEEHKIKRNWLPGGKKKIKLWVLEELKYAPGGEILLNDFLKVLSVEHRRHLDLPITDDYLFTQDQLTKMITSDMEALKENLPWMSEGNKRLVVELAIELNMDNMSAIELIKKEANVDITERIKLKRELEEERKNPSQEKEEHSTAPVRKPQPDRMTREQMIEKKDVEAKKKYKVVE